MLCIQYLQYAAKIMKLLNKLHYSNGLNIISGKEMGGRKLFCITKGVSIRTWGKGVIIDIYCNPKNRKETKLTTRGDSKDLKVLSTRSVEISCYVFPLSCPGLSCDKLAQAAHTLHPTFSISVPMTK